MKSLKNTCRVSVTLPVIMVENFREDASISGLSVSRVIYLTLKSRKPAIIAGPILNNDIQALNDAIAQIQRNGQCDTQTVTLLRENLEIIYKLIDQKELENHGQFEETF